MIHIAYQNEAFKPQIEYTFDLIFSIYGLEYQILDYDNLSAAGTGPLSLLISYGSSKPASLSRNHIHIYESDLFSQNYLKPESMPGLPLEKFNGLPVIYRGRGDFDGFIRKSDNLVETNLDIIASSFFMLSRYEEVILEAKDKFDRFPAKASLAYKEGFLNQPIVNEYMELLWTWIHSLAPELGREPLWPEDKEFVVCLTHDVDSLKKYSLLPTILSIGSIILRQRNLGLALRLALDYLGVILKLKKDPSDTFDYMLSLEKKYGFKSSFYFMAGGDSTLDARYSIDKPGVVKLIQKIEREDCEVGLHASHDSYDSLEKMAAEKERLDRIVGDKSYGCRQHNLRWATPHTWRVQEKLGLLYDTTLSFADHAGFRCGICLPFKPFDVIENRKLDIWELPLTVMEGSLQRPDYQNLPPERAYEEIIRYIETTKKFNGVFVLLWHNSSFDPFEGWAGWKEVYQKVMKYIAGRDAFVASGREILLTQQVG